MLKGVADWSPLFCWSIDVDLNLTHILFELNSADSATLLPRLYDAIRRFEVYFKSVGCPQIEHSCHLCSLKSEFCPYQAVFGQSLSFDPDIVRRHQKPPLPFIFKINHMPGNNSCIELGLVVAGTAIQHVQIFFGAINNMLVSITETTGLDVNILEIWCLDHQGNRQALSVGSQELTLLSGMEILQTLQQSDVVKIYVESPLRLLNGGSVAHSFDFCTLLRSQMRRCSSFFAYYGEIELDLDYLFLSRAAEKVTALDCSYSFTKPLWTERASLRGITGVGEFYGLTESMFQLLILGSYLNSGKGAAYAMGAYRIE
jgi:hypothetical protein